MSKEKLLKIFLIFLILQPILDLSTSLTGYYFNLPISINTVFKMIFITFICIYLLFICKSKYKKISLIYCGLFSISGIIYFLTKLDLTTFNNYFNEITYLFKYFYWIFIIIGYLNIFEETNYKLEKIIPYIKSIGILYFLFLLIPILTNTSLYSYNNTTMGLKGWFVSANEMSSLLALLFPLSFLILTREEKKWHDYVTIIIIGISLAFIGTKTSFLSLILTISFVGLYYLIKNYKNKKTYIILSIIIVSLLIGYKYIPGIDIWKNNNAAAETLIEKNDNFFQKASKYLLRVRRGLYFEKKEIYSNSSLQDKIFGIGFTNRKRINNERISKLVEIDPADIFFNYGIMGSIIYLLPLIYLAFNLFKNRKNILKSFSNYMLIYIIVLSILISIFAGHVFGAPSVSIYLALTYVLLLRNLEKEQEIKIKKQ